MCSSPSRWRQRVSDERSNGSSCWNTTSPQKYWKYGFSTHRSHSASSERLCMCLRINSPATSRVGNGGCPAPTRHTELKRPARKSQSISPASRTSGWRRLMISSRGGRNRSSWRSSRGWLIGLPPTANLAVEGTTDRPNRESQTARKPTRIPGFLAKSITCSGQIIAIDQSLPNSSRTTRYLARNLRVLVTGLRRVASVCIASTTPLSLSSSASRRGYWNVQALEALERTSEPEAVHPISVRFQHDGMTIEIVDNGCILLADTIHHPGHTLASIKPIIIKHNGAAGRHSRPGPIKAPLRRIVHVHVDVN